MDLKILIVNYHYIRESRSHRGIYNITPVEFEKQLGAIHSSGYHFVSLEALHNAIKDKNPIALNSKSCLITFDDGLKESYELGLSILDRMGIPGAFYISSATLNQDVVLDVHKFHHIQSEMDTPKILSFVPQKFLVRLESINKNAIKNQYIWDEYEAAKLKYLINFLLEIDEKEEVFQTLFSICNIPEQDFAKNLYMTQKQIKDIANRGYLGAHGKSHLPLACLPKNALDLEIAESSAALLDLTGKKIEAIAYPYGGENSLSNTVFDAVRINGFISGMTMKRGLNTETDILDNPLQLKRFDTNDVFGGKSESAYKRFFYD